MVLTMPLDRKTLCERFNKSTKYALPTLPLFDDSIYYQIKDCMPLSKLKNETLAEKWLGSKLLNKLERYGIKDTILKACEEIKEFYIELKDRDGLPNPPSFNIRIDKSLSIEQLSKIIDFILNDLLPPHLKPLLNNSEVRNKFITGFTKTNPRGQILNKGCHALKHFHYYDSHLLKDVNCSQGKFVDIASAMSINTASFVIMITYYYLRSYFTMTFLREKAQWEYKRSRKWQKEGRRDWVVWETKTRTSIPTSTLASTPTPKPEETPTLEQTNIRQLPSSYKKGFFSLRTFKSYFVQPKNFARKEQRVSLVFGTHACKMISDLPLFETVDFYVSQLLKFLPRYKAIKANFPPVAGDVLVPKEILKSFVLSFLQLSPQKWLSPTDKSARERLALEFTDRLLKWRHGENDFCYGAFNLNCARFDYFAENHLEELPLEERNHILGAISYHTLRLLSAIFLKSLRNTFKLEIEGKKLLVYYRVMKDNDEYALNVPLSPAIERNHSFTEQRNECASPENKSNVSGPIEQNACITIDDDDSPIDRKPNVVELKRRMSQRSPEKENVYDPKRVKLEKKLEHIVQNSPSQTEDILIDKIDFMKFKKDIDADQNILSVYKTIFGLALESREELRARCTLLTKENSSLKDTIKSYST